MLDIGDGSYRFGMLVFHEIAVILDDGIHDTRVGEQFCPMFRRLFFEFRPDQDHQFFFVLDPDLARIEARVGFQFRQAQNIAERIVVMIAHRGDVHIAVRCLHRADRRVERCDLAVFQIIFRDFGGLKGGGGLHQAVVDIAPGAIAELPHQCRRQSLESIEASGDVDGDHGDPIGYALAVAVDGHEAGIGLDDGVRDRQSIVWTFLAETGD